MAQRKGCLTSCWPLCGEELQTPHHLGERRVLNNQARHPHAATVTRQEQQCERGEEDPYEAAGA